LFLAVVAVVAHPKILQTTVAAVAVVEVLLQEHTLLLLGQPIQ
jgi:hypothetical protein